MILFQNQKKGNQKMTNYLDIYLEGTDGKKHSLRDFNGQKIVLYFYPKDNTSGCTLEAKDFTCLKDAFKAKGYTVIGVSKDSLKSHQSFIEKQELALLLLSDPDQKLINAFDVLKEKTMYGKSYMGVVRSTFILDKEGNITKEYRNVRAKNHAQTVLNSL